ncbi:hypothetical protein, partial [Vibrio parahaemolyticus]|uniref:hypothetical protein n=1 Tax=Vibrio parahaemolyticus TaxID=670 RepID=UPI001C60ED25
ERVNEHLVNSICVAATTITLQNLDRASNSLGTKAHFNSKHLETIASSVKLTGLDTCAKSFLIFP